MALSYALHHIEENGLAKLTNYGEYLEKFPPDARSRDLREHAPGAAPTASAAGRTTAAATRADMGAGTRSGARPLREALDCAAR